MKKYLYLLMLALTPALSFTACGDDDEDLDDIDPDDVTIVKPVLKDSGNTITFTYGESYGSYKFTITEEYNFQNDICVSARITETYPNETLAKEAENGYIEGGDASKISRKGKTITYDCTEEFKGMSKQEIKEMLQWRADEWEHHHNYQYQ